MHLKICDSNTIKYYVTCKKELMKYFIIVSILWISNERIHAQTLEPPGSPDMIDNLKTVKPKPLVGFTLPPKFLTNNEERKEYDTIGNKYVDPKKKYGTFFFEGKPQKATKLFLNLYGKISSSPIDGIFGFPPRTRTVVIDSMPNQTAKFLYNTDKGKVYALPLDNMPCLVPNEMYTINDHTYYKQDLPYNTIPNPYPKHDIIPGPLNGKISDINISTSNKRQ